MLDLFVFPVVCDRDLLASADGDSPQQTVLKNHQNGNHNQVYFTFPKNMNMLQSFLYLMFVHISFQVPDFSYSPNPQSRNLILRRLITLR